MSSSIKQYLILTSIFTIVSCIVLYISYKNESEEIKPNYTVYLKYAFGIFVVNLILLFMQKYIVNIGNSNSISGGASSSSDSVISSTYQNNIQIGEPNF